MFRFDRHSFSLRPRFPVSWSSLSLVSVERPGVDWGTLIGWRGGRAGGVGRLRQRGWQGGVREQANTAQTRALQKQDLSEA